MKKYHMDITILNICRLPENSNLLQQLCIGQFQLRPAPLDGKFPGVGTLELSNPPGCGRKKRANVPSSVNSATFFSDGTVE